MGSVENSFDFQKINFIQTALPKMQPKETLKMIVSNTKPCKVKEVCWK